MNQIAISTEVHLSTKIKDYRSKYINRGISAAVAYSAVQTAHNVNAKCILASSMSGFTTRIVSKFKPDAQIIGLSPDDAIVRQMQIYWGVRPFKSHKAETTKDLLDEATDIVLDAGLAEKDDILVLTGGGPANHRGKGVTNMLKVVKSANLASNRQQYMLKWGCSNTSLFVLSGILSEMNGENFQEENE